MLYCIRSEFCLACSPKLWHILPPGSTAKNVVASGELQLYAKHALKEGIGATEAEMGDTHTYPHACSNRHAHTQTHVPTRMHKYTLRSQVLPLEDDRKSQRVACGDLSGVVQCFSVKRGEISMAFKTLPAPSQKVKFVVAPGRGNHHNPIFAPACQITSLRFLVLAGPGTSAALRPPPLPLCHRAIVSD